MSTEPDAAETSDPIATVYITRDRKAYPFRTYDSTRWVIDEIFKRGEYGILQIDDYDPGLVVDIGANVGVFALFAAIHFPRARVLCYEPVARHHELLAENLSDFDRAETRPYGLFDRAEKRFIHYGRNNAGESSIFQGADQRGDGETIELRRASTELAAEGVERIGILKLDTEGCEVEILRDLDGLLDRVDFLLLEYHRDDDRRTIDALLADRFLLFGAQTVRVHTGVMKYVNRQLLEKVAPVDLEPSPRSPTKAEEQR